jgi:hypothetical protein
MLRAKTHSGYLQIITPFPPKNASTFQYYGLSSIEPNDAGDELDDSEEVPSSLPVSGGDRAKLLDLGKELLDQMTLRAGSSIWPACRSRRMFSS